MWVKQKQLVFVKKEITIMKKLHKKVRTSLNEIERQNAAIKNPTVIQNPDPSNKPKRKRESLNINSLKPFNVADDIFESEDITPYEDDNFYSESRDTFNEFDYEEEKFDEIEKNIDKVPTKRENKEREPLEKEIQKMINNKEMTSPQRLEAQTFLFTEIRMFAQDLEDLVRTAQKLE
ncbi:43224_t:CDS:2, partial [Gigaspora margarita]